MAYSIIVGGDGGAAVRRGVHATFHALRRALAVLPRTGGLRVGALVLLLSALISAPAAAQHFITDDAAIVDFRACQVEAWHGQVESWVQPACQLIRNLEITAGIGFIADHGPHANDADNGGRATEFMLEAKTVFRPMETNGYGWGLVAGMEFDPSAPAAGDWVHLIYAYVPVSLSLADDRLILHTNLGWHYERDEHEHNGVVHEEAHHALTWAFRADGKLTERLMLIGELFGENRYLPEYQAGLRLTVVPDRLLLDITYGGHTARGAEGLGWVVGLGWTPPPFF